MTKSREAWSEQRWRDLPQPKEHKQWFHEKPHPVERVFTTNLPPLFFFKAYRLSWPASWPCECPKGTWDMHMCVTNESEVSMCLSQRCVWLISKYSLGHSMLLRCLRREIVAYNSRVNVDGWFIKEVKTPHGCSLWRGIMNIRRALIEFYIFWIGTRGTWPSPGVSSCNL